MGTVAKFTVTAAVLVAVGVGGWYGGRIAVEHVVHDYILDNPEILPQAMDELRRREAAKALGGVRQAVETPFPGAVLGNPNGKVTLVEFSDYACGYCRQSLPDVAELIAKNPDLRIVVRELPIIGPQSPEAARMALAAAEQGKYAQFHDAMYKAGQVDAPTIAAVAKQIGLDVERARRVAASPTAEAEIGRNMDLAQRLGFTGTPSFVVGDRLIPGAVGFDQLADAVKTARGG